MRWWLRVVLTLALGPLVWWIIVGYIATQQGMTFTQWAQAIPAKLSEVYVLYTLPALVLCAILYGVDRLLERLSLDLSTVLVSPLVGYAVAWAAVHYIPEQHVQAAGAALPLFACYGLVWGLTIREPLGRHDFDDAGWAGSRS